MGKIVCKLFGHLWCRPSTVGCYFQCKRCGIHEYWCYSFETIKGGADKGYEVNVCTECHGKETITGGTLTNRERDTVDIWA